MGNEQDIQKNLQILEYYKEQLANVDMQMQYTQAALADIYKAKLTIKELKDADGDAEVMFPLGGGTFVKGTVVGPGKVLVDIGRGVVVEKPSNDALEKLQERIKELEETVNRLSQMDQKIREDAEKLSEETQKMMQ